VEAQLLTLPPPADSASTYLLSLPGSALGTAHCFFSCRSCQTISRPFQFQSLQESVQLLSPLTCRAQCLLCTCHPLLYLPWVGPELNRYMVHAHNFVPLIS
jgi:hypothetical protein